MSSPGSLYSEDTINILHVDGDEDNLLLTKIYLKDADPSINVVSVTSPDEALNALGEQPFDCVLADYLMPVMDGVKLCTEIRKRGSGVPFILYTAHGSEEVAEKAFSVGVNDYVRKEKEPSHYSLMAKRIRQAVEKQRIEQLYRTVVEGSRDALTIIQGLTYVYANQALADMVGVPGPEDVIGKSVLTWVNDDDKDQVTDRVLGRQNGEDRPSFYEQTLRREDGELRQIEISATTISYMGKPATLAFSRDISDRKRVQAEQDVLLALEQMSRGKAEAAEERIDTILERVTDAFFALDRDLNFTYVNKSAEKVLHHDREELLGRNILEAYPSVIDTAFYKQYQLALDAQEPVEFEGYFEPFETWFEVKAYPSPDGITVYLRDLTEQKGIERELRTSEERYRSLFANMTAGFSFNKILYDDDGKPVDCVCLEVNDAYEKVMGRKREDVVGKGLAEVFPEIKKDPELAERLRIFGRVAATGESARYERYAKCPKKWLSVSLYSPMKGHFAMMLEDITERKRAEEELRASEERLRLALMKEGPFKTDKRVELRKTGIELIGDVPWGTHFCQFYQTKEDLIDILVPYFRAGLENNEFCMWVTAEPLNAEEAKKAMEKTLPDFPRYLENGQIEIISYRDWYLKDEYFDSDRVLSSWVSKLEDALKRGYSGLRLTGNTFWLERNGWKAFTDYEEMINSVIGKYRMVAVCTYSLDRCNAGEIIDVVKNHQFAIVKRSGAWELIESTEHKKIENALLVSEERYRTLFDRMTEGFALHEIICNEDDEPVDYRYLEVNPAFEKLTGLKREDVIGKTVREVIPGIEPEWIKIYGEVALTGKPVSFENYSADLKRHYQVYSYSPAPRHFADLFIDITERKKIEDELTRQALMLANANDAIIGYDAQYRVTYWNKMAEQLYGYSADEALGKVGNVLLRPTYVGVTREELISQTMSTGHIESESIRVAKDGRMVNVESRVILMRDNKGEPTGFVAIDRNITERKKAEEALRETQKDLNRAQAVAKTGSWRLDIHRDELLWSDETYRIFGIPKGTPMTYETFLNAVHPDDREYVDRKWKAALEGENYNIEHRIIVDGEIKWVCEKAELDFNRDGLLLGGFGTVQDITERKLMEEELRESNVELTKAHDKILEYANEMERLVEERTGELRDVSMYARRLIEASIDLLVTISPEGKITDVNKATEMVTGVSREELIGSDFSDYFTEPENAREGYRQVFSEGMVRDYPLAIRHRSGRITDVLYNATVYRNEEGAVQGVFAAARDITVRKKLEEALKASEEMFRVSVENMIDPFGIYKAVRDESGRIVDFTVKYVNEAACRANRMTREEQLGKGLLEILPAHRETRLFDEYCRLVETGEPVVKDSIVYEDYYRGEKLSRFFDIRAVKLGDGFAAAWRDVTQREMARERLRQAEQMEAVGRMSAMIAHDLRGPLSTVNQAVEMIRRSPERADRMLKMIGDNTNRALNMIEEIRTGTREIQPQIERTDLAAMIRTISEETKMPRAVNVELEIGGDLDAVMLDPVVVRRTLENLVLNAIEAMPDGGILTLRARKKDEQICIEVSDTGTGISDEALPHMFETFYSTKSKGLGLGLPYCHRAVEALGGTLTFTTRRGEGTTFTMNLPYKRA